MLEDILAALADPTRSAHIAFDYEKIAAEIGELPEAQKAEVVKLFVPLYRQRARDSMVTYIDYAELGYKPAAHHRLLIEALEAVERGECSRLMVCMPPGSAKSTYTSTIFPAWYLGRNPEASVIAVSHTQELIERFGRRVRNLFASPLHHSVFGVGVSADSSAAARWDTTRGGEYYAVGIGGAVTGRRGDLGVIDDPVRSREDADSERGREHAWEWYVNDFVTRLKPGAAQVVVMTRWHDDDLGGRILEMEGKRWKVLKLPMEAGNDDPVGRRPGERLWPGWFTEEMVQDAKRDVRVWNALYQQEPAGEDGDYFKRDWFRDVKDAPEHGSLAIYGASDYAVSEGKGDYTEHGIFGIDSWSNLYMLDWWREQATANVWIEAQCDLIRKHEPLCWFGEAGPIRRAVEPYLMQRMTERRTFCRIEWLPSIHDKATRCRPFQSLAASEKVFVPRLAHWKADVLGQLLRFPAGMHDDAVDVCSLIGRGLEKIRAPEMANVHYMTHAIVGRASAKRYARRH